MQRDVVPSKREEDDVYSVEIDHRSYTINLENRRRDAEREDDPQALRRFVDEIASIATNSGADAQSWPEVRRNLLLALEAPGHDFSDVLWKPLTDELSSIVTLMDPRHSRITWVTTSMCANWAVEASDVVAAAKRNQDALLRGIELEIHESEEFKLGMVPLGSPYKASVVLAPSFRQWVEPRMGWPVYAVVPCRDFIYVLPEDRDLLGRLGGVVVREFKESGYPLTTEVLRISDEGIEAIGKYPI